MDGIPSLVWIVIWIVLILGILAAAKDWQALKNDPLKEIVDEGKIVATTAVDIAKQVGSQNTTLTKYGGIPCTTNEQCVQAYPSCTNCQCISGECYAS